MEVTSHDLWLECNTVESDDSELVNLIREIRDICERERAEIQVIVWNEQNELEARMKADVKSAKTLRERREVVSRANKEVQTLRRQYHEALAEVDTKEIGLLRAAQDFVFYERWYDETSPDDEPTVVLPRPARSAKQSIDPLGDVSDRAHGHPITIPFPASGSGDDEPPTAA